MSPGASGIWAARARGHPWEQLCKQGDAATAPRAPCAQVEEEPLVPRAISPMVCERTWLGPHGLGVTSSRSTRTSRTL